MVFILSVTLVVVTLINIFHVICRGEERGFINRITLTKTLILNYKETTTTASRELFASKLFVRIYLLVRTFWRNSIAWERSLYRRCNVLLIEQFFSTDFDICHGIIMVG